MREGHLPALSALWARGRVVPTKAPYGTFVGSTWPTFATALRPEHHDHWNWIHVDRDHTDHYVSPRVQQGTPFWRSLDAAGLRVAVADVPHSLAPAEFDGMFVSEWGCHDRLEGTQWTPRDLLRRLDVEPHPVGCLPAPSHSQRFAACDNHHRTGLVRTAEETSALVDDLVVGIERKGQLLSRMLDDEPDALFAVFSESHCVGHQLWHVHDPTHDRHDPAVRAAQPDDPLLTVYSALDAAVGRLVDRVGPDVPIALHLSHGMQAHYDGTHLLDALLWRMEDIDRGATPGRLSRSIGRLPLPLSRRSRGLAYGWAGRKPESTAPADPDSRARRRYYQVHNNTVVGGIRVNLAGRETGGLVPAGQRDAVLDELEQRLAGVVNLATGEPAVLRTVRGTDVHADLDSTVLPDLYVEWDRTAQLERVWSPTLGIVHVPYRHWRTGDHHDDGTIVVVAPDVEPGRSADAVDLVDVPVTLCDRLGVRIDGADGAVIPTFSPSSMLDA